MTMLSERCYICGDDLLEVPSGHSGPLLAKHRTRDHVPPDGLFLPPKPSNLICAPCCNECNGQHSSFDETLRMFLSTEISCTAAGRKILVDKVFGSTLAKVRQPNFVFTVASSMRDATIQTSEGSKDISMFTVPSDMIYPGIIRITKGLLTHFYPQYDYRNDAFDVLDIHSATLLKKDGALQLMIIQEIIKKTELQVRGNHDELKFWRQVEGHRGVWLLMFYGAVVFIVQHKGLAPAKRARAKPFRPRTGLRFITYV